MKLGAEREYKLIETYAAVKQESVREQLSAVVDEALNILIVMHVVWVEFLADTIQ